MLCCLKKTEKEDAAKGKVKPGKDNKLKTMAEGGHNLESLIIPAEQIEEEEKKLMKPKSPPESKPKHEKRKSKAKYDVQK